MAYLQVNSITKQFGGLIAVDNVSFEVEKGEIVSIIGPNGVENNSIQYAHRSITLTAERLFDGIPIHNTPPYNIINLNFKDVPEYTLVPEYACN